MRLPLAPALAAALVAAPAPDARAQDTRALVAYVDSVAGAFVTTGRTAGVSVAVVRNGRTVLAKGYGFADLENDVPATAATVYRIGSVTKQFTAAAIMRLAEQGKLSLDDTVQRFFPAYPARGNRVTVRHLLNHTSGIRSYTSLGPRFGRLMRLDVPRDSLVALFAGEPFDFEPGERYLYNNSAYYLLGMVIEQVSGKSYGQHLQDEFFGPLGLTGTRYCDQGPLIKRRAQGYAPQPGGTFTNADPISMALPYAAGSLCSTVGDLVTWTAALAGGRVVSAASYRQMTTPGSLNDGKPLNYGFGLGVGALAGHRQVSHNGGINGFVSELHHYPDDSLVTVVLTNTGSPAAVQLERIVARRALGVVSPATVPTDAAALARVAGSYAAGPARLRLFVEGGQLRFEAPGQPPLALRHVGNGRFMGVQNDDVAMEFAEGAPAPSVTMLQPSGARGATAARVP